MTEQGIPQGEKKLFYRLEFVDTSHDYNHTICRDMKEVEIYLTCEDTGLGNNINSGGDDDVEPKIEIVGVWMTEAEYQQWGEDNRCDLTELTPNHKEEGKAMHMYDVVQFDSHDMIEFAKIILAGDRRLATIQSYLEHYKIKKPHKITSGIKDGYTFEIINKSDSPITITPPARTIQFEESTSQYRILKMEKERLKECLEEIIKALEYWRKDDPIIIKARKLIK